MAAVRRAVRDGAYDVVFGAADDWMAALATYRDRLRVRVAHPDAGVVATALDKVALSRLAAESGFAVPRLAVADPSTLARWRGPVVVKCRSHWFPGQQQLHRIEARRYPDAVSAVDAVQRITDAGFGAVLQEPVDGDLGALIGLFRDGELTGRVQQHTYRVWPTPTGVSARAVTVPIDEALAARATALLTRLRWSGLVELQFLTPPGVPSHLIDLNGRFYGSMALAIAAGPNLADAWARQALGHSPIRVDDARVGVRYTWLAGDLRRATVERRGGLFADLASTAWWATGATRSVVELRDLGPALDVIASRVSRAPVSSPERGVLSSAS